MSRVFLKTHFFCITISLIFLVSLTACKEKLEPGHYEGNLFKKGVSSSTTEPVSFDITYTGKMAEIHIMNQSHTVIGEGMVWKPNKGQVHLKLKLRGQGEISRTLQRTEAENRIEKNKCYSDSGLVSIGLCFSKNRIHLEFSDQSQRPLLSLYGSKFLKEPRVASESPGELSLSGAIDEAFTKNFQMLMAVEHVFQAKNAALAAWLNLIPHLTANLIWHAPIPTYISAIAVIQGLTPFLLPSYWIDARSSDINSTIQYDALTIVQADLASNIEQLSYVFIRDSQVSQAYARIMQVLEEFETKIWHMGPAFPLANKVQPLLDLKQKLVDFVKITQGGIDRVLKEDRYAISLAIGRNNLDSVSNVSIDPEIETLENAQEINPLILSESAWQRSFERQQLNALIEIAELKKIELFFTWLDPSADQRTSLGFNLIGQERVAHSQIEELKIKKKLLRATINHNTHILALDFNEALNNSKKIVKPVALEIKLQELSNNLEKAIHNEKWDEKELEAYIRDTLAELIQYESNLAAFRVARAKKDRLLLSGYFEKLLPHLPAYRLPIKRKAPS